MEPPTKPPPPKKKNKKTIIKPKDPDGWEPPSPTISFPKSPPPDARSPPQRLRGLGSLGFGFFGSGTSSQPAPEATSASACVGRAPNQPECSQRPGNGNYDPWFFLVLERLGAATRLRRLLSSLEKRSPNSTPKCVLGAVVGCKLHMLDAQLAISTTYTFSPLDGSGGLRVGLAHGSPCLKAKLGVPLFSTDKRYTRPIPTQKHRNALPFPAPRSAVGPASHGGRASTDMLATGPSQRLLLNQKLHL